MAIKNLSSLSQAAESTLVEPASAQQLSPTATDIRDLHRAVECLEHAVSELAAVLNPVLLPDIPTPAEKEATEVYTTCSPLQTDIRTARQQLEQLTSFVSGLHTRCSL